MKREGRWGREEATAVEGRRQEKRGSSRAVERKGRNGWCEEWEVRSQGGALEEGKKDEGGREM